MSSPQDQYAASMRNSQEAVVEAVESWTKSAQSAFGGSPGDLAGGFDPNPVIDQVFDFAEKMLGVQREFAKTLAASAAEVTAAARKQTTEAGEAVRKQTAETGAAVRKQAARASEAPTPRKQTRARKG